MYLLQHHLVFQRATTPFLKSAVKAVKVTPELTNSSKANKKLFGDIHD